MRLPRTIARAPARIATGGAGTADDHRAHRHTRRGFLGGAAVIVGLPFLESALPKEARAQKLPAPVRLVYLFVPNGLDMATFRPTSTGAAYTLPPMLESLAPLKADFSVLTGLANAAGEPIGQGDHASGTSAFITCVQANKSETVFRLGISADQVAAQQLGKATRLPSLQLGIDGGATSGTCDSGYSCAYTRNISWSGPTTPLPKIVDPKQIFDQLFAGATPGASDADAAKRRLYSKSVLDSVVAEAGSLRVKLGTLDRGKLDQYLQGVREIEGRVSATAPALTCNGGTAPATGTMTYDQQVRVTMDLMVLALQCDATRIITFMYGNGLSGRTHPFLDITAGHHSISHHRSNPTNLAQLAKIGKWEVEQAGYFFQRLKDIPDGTDGKTLLYNSAVFFSSECGDGNKHAHDDLPVIMAGNGGGALSPGKHLILGAGRKEKISNVLVTMLDAAAVTAPKLGDSTGPLADI